MSKRIIVSDRIQMSGYLTSENMLHAKTTVTLYMFRLKKFVFLLLSTVKYGPVQERFLFSWKFVDRDAINQHVIHNFFQIFF